MAGGAKYLRNKDKCKAYRSRKGKPRGPGVSGNKSGKNWKPVAPQQKTKAA